MSDPASLIGEEIAHVKVIAKLGEGGMGAVFRAEDTKPYQEDSAIDEVSSGHGDRE